MTTTIIKIGGKNRPFHFSNACAFSYEIRTGNGYLRDTDALKQSLVNVATKIADAKSSGTDTNLAAADGVYNMSMVLFGNLAFSGFEYAHRKLNQPINFDVETLVGWALSDPEVISTIITKIVEATTDITPKEEVEPGAAKKKTGTKRKQPTGSS